MQSYRPGTFTSATPRLEATLEGKLYQSIDCLGAKIQKEIEPRKYSYQSSGYFQNQMESTEI